jgi:hypothetical protein
MPPPLAGIAWGPANPIAGQKVSARAMDRLHSEMTPAGLDCSGKYPIDGRDMTCPCLDQMRTKYI